MSDETKWKGWNRTITVRSRLGQEIPLATLAPPKPAGCFRFNDGTTQGWNLDQLYKTLKNPPYEQKISPYAGFSLKNSQNLALAACANPLIVITPGVTQCHIYLESPDLLSDQNWQGVTGYSIDIYRMFASLCGEPAPLQAMFQVQLQLWVIDPKDGKPHLYAEWDTKQQTYIFHQIKALTPYHLFWKPEFLSSPGFKVKQVRVRLFMPNYTDVGVPGSGECAASGCWLIGNVCPEK